MAKYLDQAGVTTLWGKIKEKFVLKDGNKVLSTNDYTTAEKQKLGAIASGAQVNVIEKVSVNGSALPVTTKGVNVTVPTKVSQVTNDSGFQTASQVSSAITKAIGGIASGFKYSVVDTLPQTGESDTIYLKANSGSGQNIYDEFIWVNSKWEQLGTKQIDLSGYMKKTDMVALTTSEIDAICV